MKIALAFQRVLHMPAAWLLILFILASGASGQNSSRQVAITIDDLPGYGDTSEMKDVISRLVKTLRDEKAPAIGFVNERKLYSGPKLLPERKKLLEDWLDAGFELGNHTFSHTSPDDVPFESYAADLIKGEKVTSELIAARGGKLMYFRHPELKTGPTERYRQDIERLLKERNYTVAPITIDNNDYIFATAYSSPKAKNDPNLRKRISDEYIDYMQRIFDHFERLSMGFLHREIRQTLLLHASKLNADNLQALISMLRKCGYRFVSLADALKDEAYQMPEAQSQRGLSWIHRWMLAKGLTMNEEPKEPVWIRQLAFPSKAMGR